MAKTTDMIWATGRRKCAVARVRIALGTGKVVVNGKDWKEYFTTESMRGYIAQPLAAVDAANKFDIFATLDGGGISGQAGALRHGIARALIVANEDLRAELKKAGMLTRDSRVKERKKPGQPGARKHFQFSKR